MAEEQTRHENAVRSGDTVTCPNCGSHNVRCIPYPKVEFGIWFVLWLIVAFGGYMISVFITISSPPPSQVSVPRSSSTHNKSPT